MRFLEVYEREPFGAAELFGGGGDLGHERAEVPAMRGRFEVEGEAGLLDRRLGKVSPHRIAADEVARSSRFTGIAMPFASACGSRMGRRRATVGRSACCTPRAWCVLR